MSESISLPVSITPSPRGELWQNRRTSRRERQYTSFDELYEAVHAKMVEQKSEEEWLSYHQLQEARLKIFGSDLTRYRAYIQAINRKRADTHANLFYQDEPEG